MHTDQSKQVTSADCIEQLEASSSEKVEVRFSEKKPNFTVSEPCFAQLKTSGNRRTLICIRPYFAKQLWRVAFYSTKYVIVHYFERSVFGKSAPVYLQERLNSVSQTIPRPVF